MAKIIKERERKYYDTTALEFYDKETNEIRFGFPITDGEIIPCNEKGKCSEEKCPWWKNYIWAKENDTLYSKISTNRHRYVENAVAICECGKEITLNYDAEECPYCGRLHNLFGQELLPRRYWEEGDYDYWDDDDADCFCD